MSRSRFIPTRRAGVSPQTSETVTTNLPPISATRARRMVFSLAEVAKAHLRRVLKAHQVRAVVLRDGLRTADIVAVVMVRNEADRMPYFLDYYARLGVQHVILIDNGSTDDLDAVIRERAQVSLLRADGSYGSARYGNDWVNRVLTKYCAGKWTLYVDADEFLVYAGSTTRALPELITVLEAHGQAGLPCLMVDLYSDQAVGDNEYRRGVDPLSVCRLYDASGYERQYEQMSRTTWVKGGVRGRAFFADRQEGPALNKIPLVRWRRRYAYLKSSHQLWPLRLNELAAKPMVSGALLHQKFLSSFATKADDTAQRGEHTQEYLAYIGLSARGGFPGPTTKEYRDPAGLVEDHLISPSPWG
ncbi:glycosyltransferase family 2 protein [uncultured Amnibacterium sp.]|uniref:glycosyltransferase family 2 protein n=1 Tax=uncultured Amnibacterium sp. TaxID=1631851 RepID=UPI0035C9BD14